jgi:hypothetical protein
MIYRPKNDSDKNNNVHKIVIMYGMVCGVHTLLRISLGVAIIHLLGLHPSIARFVVVVVVIVQNAFMNREKTCKWCVLTNRYPKKPTPPRHPHRRYRPQCHHHHRRHHHYHRYRHDDGDDDTVAGH